MSNIAINPMFSAASASVFAFLLYGAAPNHLEAKEHPRASAARYSVKGTSSSSGGTVTVAQAIDLQDFQQQVTDFYSSLSERQSNLEPALEQLLSTKISSFYED